MAASERVVVLMKGTMTEDTPSQLERRPRDVRAKRGHLLPRHGLIALAFPDLLAGYDAAYTAALGGEAHDFAARAWPRQLAPWDLRAASNMRT